MADLECVGNPLPVASTASVSVMNVNTPGSGSVAISPMQSNVVPVNSGRRVLITPLRAHQQYLASSNLNRPLQQLPLQKPRGASVIKKVLLKAVTKNKNKKSQKTFMLRNIDPDAVVSCDSLKRVIKVQLNEEIVANNEFDVGFIQGSRA